MEKDVIKDRLKKLRAWMTDENITFFVIPTADYHGSEYVSDYFKVREYFSGFTGSNGTLVIGHEMAGLWTDGRYFIQAEKELEGTTITLFRMMEEGVPTIEQFLEQHLQAEDTLAVDGRVISANNGKKYEKLCHKKQCKFLYDKDPASVLWKDRPLFPAGKVIKIPSERAGKTISQKLSQIRKEMITKEANGLFLSKLDDIMWLFNIRGCDVECNPVAMSYAYVGLEEVVLFIGEHTVSADVEEKLNSFGVLLKPYSCAEEYMMEHLNGKSRLMVAPGYLHFRFYREFSRICELVEADNPTELLKAIKTPIELSNMERIFLVDSVVVTKFIYWLKKNIGKRIITELDAAEYMDNLRRGVPEFMDLSFPTISAYGPNAAMMHYEATPESYAELKQEGMYLVDSGGQYMGGTTDVTRTIILGPITDEMKKHYSLVAASMLHMTKAVWLYGCTGRNLDILARRRLWEIGMDYKCGTGHGVGYILNVHEGPHSLRWKYNPAATEAVLEEGMDVTDEPGVYVEGSHGIRIENVLVVKKGLHNEYGQFMHFDTLTWVPLDPEGIDTKYLTQEEINDLREYQNNVFFKLAPYLTNEEKEWLSEQRI